MMPAAALAAIGGYPFPRNDAYTLDRAMTDEEMADPTNWPYEVSVDGKSYPDYASCASISTSGALREMVIPSLMAVIIPIAVGVVGPGCGGGSGPAGDPAAAAGIARGQVAGAAGFGGGD